MSRRNKPGNRSRLRRRRTRGAPRTRCNMDPETWIPRPITMSESKRVVLQFRNYLQATTSGTSLNSYIAFDPSSTTTATFGSSALFSEWSAVSTLFARVKVKQFEISMTPTYIDDTKGDNFNAVAIASVPLGTLATPNGYTSVCDNRDSVLWNPINDKSGVSKYFSAKIRGLGWGPIGSPGGTTGLGCPGSLVFFGNSLPTTVELFNLRVVGTYIFDGRI